MAILLLAGCSQAAPADPAKLLAEAGAKEKAGDVAGALALYETALKAAPQDPALHIHIAQAAYNLKKPARGIQAIDRLMTIEFPSRDTGALLRLKGLFEAMQRGDAPAPAPAPAAAKAAPASLSGRDRLELDTLNEIYSDAQGATDAAQQKKLLTELLRRSQSLAEAHPEQTAIWLMRAAAAVTLDRPREGWEAGQKLIAQGALDSQEKDTRQVMAQLNRKKWLVSTPSPSERASPGQKYENSLGMKFAPVSGTEVLFCIWETRVKDYAAYAAAHPDAEGSWRNVKFNEIPVSDGPTHPVVNVSWEDAQAFCVWLTKKEQEEGRLSDDQRYRLPTDLEWSAAVGLRGESGETPKERDLKVQDVFPWGTEWPPPRGAGNFGDETAAGSFPDWRGQKWIIEGYTDGYATTAPVGSFSAHRAGLYDMSGNVWEWCEDWYGQEEKYRVLRGGSWFYYFGRDLLLSSGRNNNAPGNRNNNIGFRCVLVASSVRKVSQGHGAMRRGEPPCAARAKRIT